MKRYVKLNIDQQKIKLYELITDEPHFNIKDKSKKIKKKQNNLKIIV